MMQLPPRLLCACKPLMTFVFLGACLSHVIAEDIDLSKLPLPEGAKKVFVDANSAIYSIGTSQSETAEACEKLLLHQGWVPYGFAGNTRYYKRGGTRLLATVQAAVGKPGAAMITFNKEPLSADIPLPPDTEEVQYSDSSKQLGFLTALGPDGVADFYRKALAQSGWSTNMEKPDKTDFVYTIIFRSPTDEMMRIEMTPTSGKLRTMVTYNTAGEVAAERQLVAKGMAAFKEKLAKEASAPKPTVAIALPPSTISKALTSKNLKMNLPANSAKAAVQSLLKDLLAAGWKEATASLESIGGTAQLTLENRTLTIVYIDPGFMPAEVTITPGDVEIKLAE